MTYQVLLVEDAELDLIELYPYLARNDSVFAAEHLLDAIKNKCASLAQLAQRGHVPPKLERIGVFEYRETHYKPYKIIYQILDRQVFIHCILDGRRNLEDLLHRRLLR